MRGAGELPAKELLEEGIVEEWHGGQFHDAGGDNADHSGESGFQDGRKAHRSAVTGATGSAPGHKHRHEVSLAEGSVPCQSQNKGGKQHSAQEGEQQGEHRRGRPPRQCFHAHGCLQVKLTGTRRTGSESWFSSQGLTSLEEVRNLLACIFAVVDGDLSSLFGALRDVCSRVLYRMVAQPKG